MKLLEGVSEKAGPEKKVANHEDFP